MLLGALPAGDAGDEERRGGLPPHRLPLRLHGHVPLPAGAAAEGRTRPAARGSDGRRRGGGASRGRPRRAGEHLGGDQRGDIRVNLSFSGPHGNAFITVHEPVEANACAMKA